MTARNGILLALCMAMLVVAVLFFWPRSGKHETKAADPPPANVRKLERHETSPTPDAAPVDGVVVRTIGAEKGDAGTLPDPSKIVVGTFGGASPVPLKPGKHELQAEYIRWVGEPQRADYSAKAKDYFVQAFKQYDVKPRDFRVSCGTTLCRAEFEFDSQEEMAKLDRLPRDPERELSIGAPEDRAGRRFLEVYFGVEKTVGSPQAQSGDETEHLEH